ncbi:myosin-11-like [Drosophila tropicalis]|uniref:myosin-11-like n=1 Tax=Drosophila tropicalis TaxID=46794 RepID=UPI0035AB8882
MRIPILRIRRKKKDHEILELLKKGDEELRKLNHKVHDLSNSQKGIEVKIKQQREQLEGITRLEEGLVKIQNDTAHSFQLTASGVKNLTANIRSFEAKNDKALQNLGKVELQIKEVIGKVDANQNKYENDIKGVSKSVEKRLDDLNKLLKQSIIEKLVSLDRTAKKLESTQKNIEQKALYLDELNELAGRANYKVDHLEQSLQQLNYTQNQRLTGISVSVHEVEVGVGHLDKKLAELLGNQQIIERILKDCNKWKHPNKPSNPQNIWTPPQPDYGQSFGFQQEQVSYASAEEAAYLHKLWYGKD